MDAECWLSFCDSEPETFGLVLDVEVVGGLGLGVGAVFGDGGESFCGEVEAL